MLAKLILILKKKGLYNALVGRRKKMNSKYNYTEIILKKYQNLKLNNITIGNRKSFTIIFHSFSFDAVNIFLNFRFGWILEFTSVINGDEKNP